MKIKFDSAVLLLLLLWANVICIILCYMLYRVVVECDILIVLCTGYSVFLDNFGQ